MDNTKITAEQKQKLRNAVLDPKARFAFLPYPALKEAILKASDQTLNQLPQSTKAVLLEMPNDAAIALDNQMVLSYIEGTLDAANTYFLAFGEIRVVS